MSLIYLFCKILWSPGAVHSQIKEFHQSDKRGFQCKYLKTKQNNNNSDKDNNNNKSKTKQKTALSPKGPEILSSCMKGWEN